MIEELKGIMEPEVEDMGLELVEATLLNKGGRLILYVAIDKEDGVTVDDCGLVSKRLSIILDENDLLKGQYDLEVSSPGINRPLTKKSHFEQFSGQRVKIKTKMPINGSRNFTGVFEAKDDGVSVTIDDEKTEIPYENIKKANLKIDVKFS
ncbi:MAG TPA: ribosome maturation factor RimP [Actinobacteria bacterium]|nr:ribosome maturation factor RimP [Actinomycetota bacterium]